jgi:hypothetical protein
MGKCKHPARVWLWWVCDDMQYAYFTAQRAKGLGWSWFGRGLGDPHARWCAACGAWLSLGPSNDRGKPVSIEMRAARLAAKWAPVDRECHAVRDGWYCHRDGIGPRFNNVYGQAGYLAREIATHATASGEVE